jgi:hypothetical protein
MKTSADLKAEILIAPAHPNRIRILEHMRKDVRSKFQKNFNTTNPRIKAPTV